MSSTHLSGNLFGYRSLLCGPPLSRTCFLGILFLRLFFSYFGTICVSVTLMSSWGLIRITTSSLAGAHYGLSYSGTLLHSPSPTGQHQFRGQGNPPQGIWAPQSPPQTPLTLHPPMAVVPAVARKREGKTPPSATACPNFTSHFCKCNTIFCLWSWQELPACSLHRDVKSCY